MFDINKKIRYFYVDPNKNKILCYLAFHKLRHRIYNGIVFGFTGVKQTIIMGECVISNSFNRFD